MNVATPACLVAAMLALAACDIRVGDRDGGNAGVAAGAAGNAGEGEFSLSTPGFNLSIDLPDSLQGEIHADNSGLVYPGARIRGLRVEAGRDPGVEDRVRIDFSSGDGPDRLVAWYRDPARGPDVRIASTAARGEATVISGMRDEDRFELRIAPGPDGGSQARLVLTDSDR